MFYLGLCEPKFVIMNQWRWNVRVVWQGSGSSENDSGSGSFEGAAPLKELNPFWKMFGKTAPSH